MSTHAAFEVGLSLDQGQGVYSGRSDVVGSSQVRLCHTCIIDVMQDLLTWFLVSLAGSMYFALFPGSHPVLFSIMCFTLLFSVAFSILALNSS